MSKLVLIDGMSILNRAFYALPILSNAKGVYTNAVYGFLNIMFKVLDEENADYLAVAFDLSKPTFRHEAYELYKANRKTMPEELRVQIPLIKEVLKSMNIKILSKEGFEADDIIGTIAKKYKDAAEVRVISGDRDLLQLAEDKIKIRIPKTVKGSTQIYDYFPEDVKRDYSVSPKEFIDVKALMGDSSDNVPGVAGIGEKTATALIAEYHSLDNLYANLENLKPRAAKLLTEGKDDAYFSKMLVTINCKVPIEVSLEDMKGDELYNAESLEMMKTLEFKTLIKRFEAAGIKSKENFEFNIVNIDDVKELDKIKNSQPALELIYDDNKSPKQLIALSVCADKDKVYYIYIKDENFEEAVKKWLNKVIDKKVLYVRELKSLVKYLGLETNKNINDLAIAAYLNNPLKGSYEVFDMAREYLDINLDSYKDVLAKRSPKEALESGDEKFISLLCSYACVLYHVKESILAKTEELGMEALYTDIELPLVYSLASMELKGIGIDKEKLEAYADELDSYIKEIEKEIHKEAGAEFNINSPKQLGEILFEKMGIKGGKKTKTGYSTAADVLEKLAPEYSIVGKILKYRQFAKLHSTYALGLANYIDEDGRIHGSFNQTITATGRLSSTDPNLQNIPIRTEMGSRIRDIFVPREGYVFVDADYSQIELRVLASMSDDEKLIESYKKSEDIHAITASEVFHVPLDKVDATLRRNAKAVNFGVVYGISAFGLSEGLSISRKEALEYINNYFKSYPKVKEFLDRQVKEAKEKGYVRTLYNRIRPIPEIKSSNFMQRAFGDRVAMNSPIQGTAADIMKKAMLDVDKALKKYGDLAYIVLQVHDELLIEVKEESAKEVRDLVEKTMKAACKLAVELEVEAHIGRTWLSAK